MTSRKRNGLLLLTTLATLGASGTASAAAAADRGTVVARGHANKVVVAGPAAVHVYSQFAGGAIYTAPSRTGTDRDCAGAAGPAIALATDRVAVVSVGPGQVACLSTSARGSFELVWHAVGRPAPTATLLAKAGR
ncbi:MAG TPA: hypothetical protein VMT03_16780 [Polyangia bacterium]|nr:hypothetical protein [Polyangia bacterium]